MKILLFSFAILAHSLIAAQFSSVVIDTQTLKPVPYVNIWIKGELRGTSSDHLGQFTVLLTDTGKVILLSAVGYRKREILITSRLDSIFLTPEPLTLEELVVVPKNEQIINTTGTLKKRKVSTWHQTTAFPFIGAQYFTYQPQYRQTPYVGKIRLITKSDVSSPKLQIRLYAVGQDSKPGPLLHDSPILFSGEKGKVLTEVDVRHLNITFPHSGLFVAVETLMIEENKVNVTKKDEEAGIAAQYAPSIGLVRTKHNQVFFQNYHGHWFPFPDLPEGMSFGLAAEVILTD